MIGECDFPKTYSQKRQKSDMRILPTPKYYFLGTDSAEPVFGQHACGKGSLEEFRQDWPRPECFVTVFEDFVSLWHFSRKQF